MMEYVMNAVLRINNDTKVKINFYIKNIQSFVAIAVSGLIPFIAIDAI